MARLSPFLALAADYDSAPYSCFHLAFIQHVGNMSVPKPHDDAGVGARDDLFDLLAGKNAALQKSSGHLLNSGPAPAHDLCRIGFAHMTKVLPHLLRFDAVEQAIDFGHI